MKASEAAIERNWDKSRPFYKPFHTEFILLAGRFSRIGDKASTQKWSTRYQANNPANEIYDDIEIYHSAGLIQEARAIVDALPKPVGGPFSAEREEANKDWNEIMWRRFALAEANAVRFSKPSSSQSLKLIPFAVWCQKLPLAARAEALPGYASNLSSRNSSSFYSIRDSGLWELGE